MNKQRVLWGVVVLCGAVVLLLSGSQPLWAVSTISGRQVPRGDPSLATASLGAVQIAGGAYHTCAVTTLGGAQCWGYNANGELGNNSTTSSIIPVDVSGLASGVTAITAGYDHTCALTGGTVKCWGDDSYGQLGDGSTTASHTPVPVVGLSGVTAIAAGHWFTCALTSGGGVKCWGKNEDGQLGNNSIIDSHVPVDVSGLVSGVTMIAAGGSHSCALLSTGTVKCWGANWSGQLGNNSTTDSSIPVQVTGITGVTAIATGGGQSCALTNAGQVKCWGDNTVGELGDGTTIESHIPVSVSGLSGVAAIKSGGYHTCVVAGGGVKCWGSNSKGELGNNAISNSSVPVDVSGLGSGVVQVALGDYASCVVMNTGAVKCWGDNQFGQLGIGETNIVSTAVDVNGLSGNIIAIGTGANHSCALTSGGGVKCWGANRYGQLGNNSPTYSLAPVDVSGLTSGVAAIAVAQDHNCALVAGGVKCWGYNYYGQLGNNSTTDSPVPVNVSGLGSGVIAIAAGYEHSCAVLSVGGVKCWGHNNYGQLGNNTTTDSSIPVDVTGLALVTSIGAGDFHTCAVAGGGAKCWGSNYSGELGNGTTTGSPIPVSVSGLASGVATVAAGGSYSCARLSGGGIKCWGINWQGELGNGSTTNSSVPVDVSGLTTGASAISAGERHSCALTSAGGAKCWGFNLFGELGNNLPANSSVPVDVTGLTSGVSVIAAGGDTSCAIAGPLSGGTAKCWGDNYYGQVGNGHKSFYPTPVDLSALPGQPPLYLPIVLR